MQCSYFTSLTSQIFVLYKNSLVYKLVICLITYQLAVWKCLSPLLRSISGRTGHYTAAQLVEALH